jgi:uncharacterized protein (UPF0276 family)
VRRRMWRGLRRRLWGLRGITTMLTSDRFGLTWHPALAPDIVRARESIDTLEVIPEVALRATRGNRDFLRILSKEIPVSLHGVSLGLASASPIEEWRLDEMARLVEDVATLLDPPGSTCDEQTWLCNVLEATDAPLLLDLHNVCTNAVNLHYDAKAFVRALPLERISTVHIAGGTDAIDTATGVVLRVDDHRHEVPVDVFELLTLVGALAPQPLTVVLERDGDFPPFKELIIELEQARAALAAGRRAAEQQESTARSSR